MVDWDHTKPPGKRINSIHLTRQSRKHEDYENPEDFIDFESTLHGTAIEVKRPGLKLGAEVKNEAGGRIFYVVSTDLHAPAHLRSPASTCLMALTASRPSRTASSSLMTRLVRA